jgi:hypothetical protein
MTLKALTLWQPWASLIALGVKTIETRSWPTKYRGPLAIHAAVRLPKVAEWRIGEWWTDEGPSIHRAGRELADGMVDYSEVDGTYYPLPLGAVVATCNLVDCIPMEDLSGEGTPSLVIEGDRLTLCVESGEHNVSDQLPYGDFRVGRFAWLLSNITPLAEPIPAIGRQGIFNLPTDVEERVRLAVAA